VAEGAARQRHLDWLNEPKNANETGLAELREAVAAALNKQK
jgi:hypothetical protein